MHAIIKKYSWVIKLILLLTVLVIIYNFGYIIGLNLHNLLI